MNVSRNSYLSYEFHQIEDISVVKVKIRKIETEKWICNFFMIHRFALKDFPMRFGSLLVFKVIWLISHMHEAAAPF